ncbi:MULTISPECIES: hypothetical protein [Laceyella]|jgi:hypothetical protein|uniref:Uncharacterized protein n=2 Tax=Laceyella TaxID=292635 RepID=A0ABY5U1M8_LACSH|nr:MULTISPECIES: hypothetical protein [Laceyella]PRZ16483.1 hypothetical protein CLV36_102193 [Laceyella sediminis]TCW39230.1 hypothetical protein EDC32_102477 [Laceyella sacchari]UWE03534.1 hypothetical protein NYR52_15765 [Laceyella sacchari]
MRRQKMASDAYNSMLGIFNGLLISLPVWGVLYFLWRMLHLWSW